MSLISRLRSVARVSRAFAIAQFVNASWHAQQRRAKTHELPGKLAVSLTSYPPRFPTLALTLKSLLAQSVRPDRIYLWIAENDLPKIPSEVASLQDSGLTIRSCEDLRSYKKIIPALEESREEFIIIADDDVYYPPLWLAQFVHSYRPGKREVIFGRGHRIILDSSQMPIPYIEWEFEVTSGEASQLLFPTGIGGVMYVPGIFHKDVTRRDLFQQLCPTADDIWLYWMAALNGANFRKVGPRKRPITWFNSQRVSLFSTNTLSNDEQIKNMIARYGRPKGYFLESSH